MTLRAHLISTVVVPAALLSAALTGCGSPDPTAPGDDGALAALDAAPMTVPAPSSASERTTTTREPAPTTTREPAPVTTAAPPAPPASSSPPAPPAPAAPAAPANTAALSPPPAGPPATQPPAATTPPPPPPPPPAAFPQSPPFGLPGSAHIDTYGEPGDRHYLFRWGGPTDWQGACDALAQAMRSGGVEYVMADCNPDGVLVRGRYLGEQMFVTIGEGYAYATMDIFTL